MPSAADNYLMFEKKTLHVLLEPSKGFPSGSNDKEFASYVGDLSSILGSVRSPGERNGYPLQYF